MEATNDNLLITQVAEVDLVYRSTVKPSMRPKITSAEYAYKILLESWDKDKVEFIEQFKVLLLNKAFKVLGLCLLSTGGISYTPVDPKLVFMAAIKAGASGILLVHNHPSGNLEPSQADIRLTQKIVEGGRFLEINVMDHLIISTEGYYSFSDEGML